MRYRTTILLLLACLLGAVPFVQQRAAEARCGVTDASPLNDLSGLFGPGPEQSACGGMEPFRPSAWVRGLGVLSVVCLGGFFVSLGANLVERRREQRLLRGAGVAVGETDLPLEE